MFKVKHSNRSNSAANCSISLKFGTEFHQITGDMFKVKPQMSRSQRNVSTVKRLLRRQRIGWAIDFKLNWHGRRN